MQRAISLSFLFLLLAVVFAQKDAADWGTVVPTTDGVQANSWITGVRDQTASDARLLQASDPATPSAPTTRSSAELTNSSPAGLGIGRATALETRAFRNAYPENVQAPGVSYADSSFSSIDIGVPVYVGNPNGGTQLSPIGIHLEACRALAVSIPGNPVRLHGNCANGYVSVAGLKIAEIPSPLPLNHKIRIPTDQSLSPTAYIYINEQVTTDNQGKPTIIEDTGNYEFNPRATSGYINIARVISLGTEMAERTIGHAAVIRDGMKTDSLAPTQPPSFL